MAPIPYHHLSAPLFYGPCANLEMLMWQLIASVICLLPPLVPTPYPSHSGGLSPLLSLNYPERNVPSEHKRVSIPLICWISRALLFLTPFFTVAVRHETYLEQICPQFWSIPKSLGVIFDSAFDLIISHFSPVGSAAQHLCIVNQFRA